jgi:hypothetical protein
MIGISKGGYLCRSHVRGILLPKDLAQMIQKGAFLFHGCDFCIITQRVTIWTVMCCWLFPAPFTLGEVNVGREVGSLSNNDG